MAVINKNGLYYDDAQLRKNNTNVANQALASLRQSQGVQQAAQPAVSLPQGQQTAQAQVQTPQAISRPNAGINTTYGYTPSQSVLDAYDYLQSVINSRPGEYQSRYADQLQGMLDQIMNRQPFQYDANADPLFQIYKDQYIMGGKRAMQDTMGAAAALTGGYGNSYAQTVGQQQYNQYMERLMGIIPELSEMAYGRYQDEGDALERNYNLLNALENQEYGRYRDIFGDWQTERQMAENTYGTERGFDYGAFSDKRTYDQQESQFAQQMALQNAQLALQREQFEWQKEQAKKKSSGGGGSSSKSSAAAAKEEPTQTAYEIQKNANDASSLWFTANEWQRRKDSPNQSGRADIQSSNSYGDYIEKKTEEAYNSGKISLAEAGYILDKYAQYIK